MRVIALIGLILLASAASAQVRTSEYWPNRPTLFVAFQDPKPQPSVPVSEADQKKIDEIVAEMQRLQTAFQLQQARLEAATATAMARLKLSPDEHELTTTDGGKYAFRKKQPPTTAATPKPPAKNP